MITHANLHSNIISGFKEYIQNTLPSQTSGGVDISVSLSFPKKEKKKPVVVIYDSRIQEYRPQNKGFGSSVKFSDYGETEDESTEYFNGRWLQIDMSLIVYADSHTERMEVSGILRDIVHSFSDTPLKIKDFSLNPPDYPTLPSVVPEVYVDDTALIDLRTDNESKSDSFVSTIRFPLVVGFAEPQVVDMVEDIVYDSDVILNS